MDFLSRLTARARGVASPLEPDLGSLQARLGGVRGADAGPAPSGLAANPHEPARAAQQAPPSLPPAPFPARSTSPDRTAPEPVRLSRFERLVTGGPAPIAEPSGASVSRLPGPGDVDPHAEGPQAPAREPASAAAVSPATPSPAPPPAAFPTLVPVHSEPGEPWHGAPHPVASDAVVRLPVRAGVLEPRPEPPPATHAADSAPGPVIRVTIGRVEVRAVAPPTPPPRPARAGRRPAQSLDAYLSQRERARR